MHGLLATLMGAAAWFTLPIAAAVSTPYGAFLFGCFAFFRPFSFLRALRVARLGRLRTAVLTGLRGLRRGFLVGLRRVFAFGLGDRFGVLDAARARTFGLSKRREADQCQSNH